ncbi:hypothetical protein F4604DRAFT_1588971, partial [Suillus subluteus]
GNEHFDPRCGLSSIWLTETYVDQFKDKVQHVHHTQNQRVSHDPDDPWIDEPDSRDSSELSTVCVDHRQNAAPDSLADDAKQLNLQGVVPAFHRHAHNRLCQVEHHSKYKVGAGKEDFETCEQVFSGSNALAGEICNATDFHHHQALDEYFRFQDMDQYTALSKSFIVGRTLG